MADAIAEMVSRIEADLGLPKNFLSDLERNDDWSLVIKGHSLIEAAVNRLLFESLNKPELEPVIEKMGLGSQRGGKLAFVHALGLLPDTLFRFVVEFAQVRNSVIHRIQNVSFTFADHIASLNKEQLSSFAEWMRVGESANVVRDGKTYSRREYVLAFPKFAAWAALVWTLVYIYTTKSSLNADKRLVAAKQKAGLGLIAEAMRQGNEPQANP